MKKNLAFFVIIFCLNIGIRSQTIRPGTSNKNDPALNLLLSKNISTTTGNLNKQSVSTIGVVVKSTDISELKKDGYDINSTFSKYATIRIKANELQNLSRLPFVSSISLGPTYYAVDDVTDAVIGSSILNSGYLNNTQYKGKHVLICIIDTGIDWSNLDFRSTTDTAKSRIIYLWDQTLTKQGNEETPQDRDPTDLSGLNYGVEYTQAEIDNEIDGTPAGFVRERDTDGHGTHVAGIAAGNGASLPSKKYIGIAPEADLLIVKAGNGSFQNSNVIDAISYANKVATSLNEPVVINLSLGSEDDPHDGTSIFDQAVDNFTTSANGRVVVAAAGNNGGTSIHLSGSIANSVTAHIPVSVPSGYTPVSGKDKNYFGFELWFNSNGGETVTLTEPNSSSVSTTGTNQTSQGTVFLSNSVNSNNNDREIYLYVYNGIASINPASGTWTLNVTNNSGGTMQYQGWLFTSSMSATLPGGDDISTIESPGTATNTITVGSYVTRWRWQDYEGNSWRYSGSSDQSDNISTFSSLGPRRDGALKPDIIAPGQGIISTRSSSYSPDSSDLIAGGKYFVDQGTSMASPAVTGSAALLLQQNPNLSYSEIKTLLTSNAESDNYTSTVPNNTWGYGKLNVYDAMVDLINPTVPRNYSEYTYDQWNSSGSTNIGPNNKIAVRFSPIFSGKVVGVLIHPYTTINITGSIYFEVWSDNNGVPGTKLGSTVAYNASDLLPFSWNYINLEGTEVSVTDGTNYEIVAYFTSGSSTGIMLDSSNPNSRSSLFNGSTWTVQTLYNYRMRAIVASDDSMLTSIEKQVLPAKYGLSQNYPNPFNPSTTIQYSIEKAGFVTIKVYDILGREIKTLVSQQKPAGTYSVKFNAINLSSGIYFYRIQSGDFTQTKKMILLK